MSRPEAESNELQKSLERLNLHDHICLLYKNRDQQFAAAIPFMRIGLERHEKCVYIADENTAAEVLEALRAECDDIDAALDSGSLSIVSKRETYLRQGAFNPDAMIAFLKETTEAAKAAGFAGLRATGEMTWALGPEPGVERLIEYEAKLNDFLPEYDALAICQYNSDRFDANALLGVIRTHPIAIIGDVVGENPFFVPREEALRPNPGADLARLLESIVEREQLRTSVEQSTEKVIKDQVEAAKLSTPVLQVRKGLLAIPIVGRLDGYRTRRLTEQMLKCIREARAKAVVLDITGVPVVDSDVANHLIQTVQAARLLGASVIITGVSPANAQTLVRIGVDLNRLKTTSSLQSGIEECGKLLRTTAVAADEAA